MEGYDHIAEYLLRAIDWSSPQGSRDRLSYTVQSEWDYEVLRRMLFGVVCTVGSANRRRFYPVSFSHRVSGGGFYSCQEGDCRSSITYTIFHHR